MIKKAYVTRRFILFDTTLAYQQLLVQLLPTAAILFCLIFGLYNPCPAQSSIYFYPGNKSGFGDPNNSNSSRPVMIKNWLYLYSYTSQETEYRLWRARSNELPSDPNSSAFFDPNSAWKTIG